MKKLLAIMLIASLPLVASAVTVLTVDDSGNLTAIGALAGTTFTFTGDLTLANAETVDNASDAYVRLTFNDDGSVIGGLVFESENAAGSMGDGDSFLLEFKANDSGGNLTTIATIDAGFDDVTDTSEDASLSFSIIEGASSITPLSLSKTGLTLENGEIIDNGTADRFVDIVFDDDSADLGTLKLKSSNAAGSVANSDHLDIVFSANDAGGDQTEYAVIEGTVDDKTIGQEDGSLVIKAQAAGSEVTVATFGGTAITLSKEVTSTLDINANGNIVGDGSTTLTNTTVWVDAAGYWDILDSTQLVFIVSGTKTNVIDADINN